MATPSANWLALKRTLSTSGEKISRPSKRRKLDDSTKSSTQCVNSGSNVRHPSTTSTSKISQHRDRPSSSGDSSATKIVGDPDSVENLAAMILRPTTGMESAVPTKFLALDCEMVGVGPFGLESALARVTIVNFVGDVIMDEFVLPQETVTDWRTAVSGVRKEDMANAKTFIEVQNRVAELLKDRYLVGHALKNDLDALLLSHPWLHTRDTQGYHVFKNFTQSKRPSLRKLVKRVFSITIQEGEHSSVIDARAPMALYRLYRKEWEMRGGFKEPLEAISQSSLPPTERPAAKEKQATSSAVSRKAPTHAGSNVASSSSAINKSRITKAKNVKVSKKRKAPSTGLSVIVRRRKA